MLLKASAYELDHPVSQCSTRLFHLLFSENATRPRDDAENPSRTPGTPVCFPAVATSLSHLRGLLETLYMPLRLQREHQTACAKS